MSSRIECPHCASVLKLPRAALGRRVRCPDCERPFTAELGFDDADETDFMDAPPRARRAPHASRPQGSRVSVAVAVVGALCVALVLLLAYVLTRGPAPVAVAPPVDVPLPAVKPAEPNEPQPDRKDVAKAAPKQFGEGFRDLLPDEVRDEAKGDGSPVILTSAAMRNAGFGPREQLCVDYRFREGQMRPAIGMMLILRNGNRVWEVRLMGILQNQGTISVESIGIDRIPAGTEIWMAEGVGGMGMGRFGPQPKRVSNVITLR